jgi:hypothetical protein
MVAQVIGTAAASTAPFAGSSVAKRLGPNERKDLSVQVLARREPVSRLAAAQGVSRKFLCQQARKADQALDKAFAAEEPDDRVLFHLPVTKDWIRQFVLTQVLIGHSSYRAVGEILEAVFDWSGPSVGTVHNIVAGVVERARGLNRAQDLGGIRVGAHDEIYQANRPVLVGVDVKSLYCYLLAEQDHADETTWGVRLLSLGEQNLAPDYTVADGGRGLRAGQRAAWPDIPCHGDVFHAERDLGKLAFFLEHRAAGCTSARQKLERHMERAKRRGQGRRVSKRLALIRQEEVRAIRLAGDIRLLTDWMKKDILELAGPSLAIRCELFDFVVEELTVREGLCPHRISPVRRALEQQRDDLLAFAGILDEQFADLAAKFAVPPSAVQEVCQLEGLDQNTPGYWQAQGRLRRRLQANFPPVQQAVRHILADTRRASSLVENLNSRLRCYFFLRRDLGDGYLDLLQFFLNHRRFLRSECPQRVQKSPTELLTGQPHAHWLELLGFKRFHRN